MKSSVAVALVVVGGALILGGALSQALYNAQVVKVVTGSSSYLKYLSSPWWAMLVCWVAGVSAMVVAIRRQQP